MFGAEVASVVDAAVVIGAVLVEALVLYVGYGALERRFGPRLVRALGGS